MQVLIDLFTSGAQNGSEFQTSLLSSEKRETLEYIKRWEREANHTSSSAVPKQNTFLYFPLQIHSIVLNGPQRYLYLYHTLSITVTTLK